MSGMDYKSFLKVFGTQSGYDFSNYSENSISRRLQKICEETGLTFEEILDKIVGDRSFVRQIVEDITVNTTELFRDPSVWAYLRQNMYPKLPKMTKTTIWHIGCSTGLEVYSDLVMLSEMGMLENSRVYGTDINESVLEVARAGEYVYSFNKNYVTNFDEVMKESGFAGVKFDKYFEIDEKNDLIKVRDILKGRPTFMKQDLVKDKAPFPYKVDCVFLRNVMIYFDEQLQTKILGEVKEKMHPEAVLIMGKQEEVPVTMKNQFRKAGLFYKKHL